MLITFSRVAQSLTQTWVHPWTDRKPDEDWVATERSAWAWHPGCLHSSDWWTPAVACAGAGRMASPGKQQIWRKKWRRGEEEGDGREKGGKRAEQGPGREGERGRRELTWIQLYNVHQVHLMKSSYVQDCYMNHLLNFCLYCWAYHPWNDNVHAK